jgi:hypothetical protein
MSQVTDPLEELEAEYAPHEHRPLGAYVLIAAVHLAVAGGGLAAAVRTRKLPDRVAPADLALGAVATFKLSRLLARSTVTSPIRAPFTRYEGLSGPAELAEEVRGTGLRKAVGELLTCPFCLAHWIATGYGFGLVFAPRATRFAASVLAVEAATEQLQLAHCRLHDDGED